MRNPPCSGGWLCCAACQAGTARLAAADVYNGTFSSTPFCLLLHPPVAGTENFVVSTGFLALKGPVLLTWHKWLVWPPEEWLPAGAGTATEVYHSIHTGTWPWASGRVNMYMHVRAGATVGGRWGQQVGEGGYGSDTGRRRGSMGWALVLGSRHLDSPRGHIARTRFQGSLLRCSRWRDVLFRLQVRAAQAAFVRRTARTPSLLGGRCVSR